MCIAGARWVQEELLDKNPDSDLHVYAVWLPMLISDKFGRWGAKVLVDARVTHYWDGEQAIGRWFAANAGVEGGSIAWDVYFLYGPGAEWTDEPAPLISSGCPIISDVETLGRHVRELAQ